ncbi:hypothetical protein [Gracilimonas sp. BCB1]|uniref:hypothetical protein n=1 Tax=Gracilimonas sp. BCB1 TaxID=3152362 RepID=UPI0032D98D5E
MSRFKNYISVAFLLLAVVGLLSSMAHYHSDGLECLHHANEQHYTESDSVCPVCTIVTHTFTGDTNELKHMLEFQEKLIAFQALLISNEPFNPLLGRSPPSLV